LKRAFQVEFRIGSGLHEGKVAFYEPLKNARGCPTR
jgi:hypothetical protein